MIAAIKNKIDYPEQEKEKENKILKKLEFKKALKDNQLKVLEQACNIELLTSDLQQRIEKLKCDLNTIKEIKSKMQQIQNVTGVAEIQQPTDEQKKMKEKLQEILMVTRI